MGINMIEADGSGRDQSDTASLQQFSRTFVYTPDNQGIGVAHRLGRKSLRVEIDNLSERLGDPLQERDRVISNYFHMQSV